MDKWFDALFAGIGCSILLQVVLMVVILAAGIGLLFVGLYGACFLSGVCS